MNKKNTQAPETTTVEHLTAPVNSQPAGRENEQNQKAND